MELVWLLILLSAFGAADSFYTALQQKFSSLPEFCFSKKLKRVSCYEILHSKYARIFLVPNSWLGIFSYILLALIFYYASVFSVVGAERLFLVGALISSAGLVFSYYLLHIQHNVLEKYCIFCLTSTFLITLITLFSWVVWFS